MDAFEDTPLERETEVLPKRERKRLRTNVEELPADPDCCVTILTPLDPFHSQLIAPRISWYNEDVTRSQHLLESLVPTRVSLRLIDHLVVQFARETPIMIKGDGDVPFDLWSDYRRMLASIGKRFFDVFKRKYHVTLDIMGQRVEATLGQIIFMSWYIQHDLPAYMRDHIEEVRAHMRRMEANFKDKKNNMCKGARAPSRTNIVKPIPLCFDGKFELDFN